jgi:hypothetical protein
MGSFDSKKWLFYSNEKNQRRMENLKDYKLEI